MYCLIYLPLDIKQHQIPFTLIYRIQFQTRPHPAFHSIPAADLFNESIFIPEESFKYKSAFKDLIWIKNKSVIRYMRMNTIACNYSTRMDLTIKNPFNEYNGKSKRKRHSV